MVQKKICLIGTSAVGKTSLVSKFVHSIFSEKYLTTVGVKIDKKIVPVDGSEMMMMIWDLVGVDEFQKLNLSYLRGSNGYLLVADGTRGATLDRALEIRRIIEEEMGPLPFVLAMNKVDLHSQWEVPAERLASFTSSGWRVQLTSAKTGEGVEAAFASLAQLMKP